MHKPSEETPAQEEKQHKLSTRLSALKVLRAIPGFDSMLYTSQYAIADMISVDHAELQAAREREKKLLEAINWACGCGEDDFRRIDYSPCGTYWWRSELVKRAGLTYDGRQYAVAADKDFR